MSDITEIIDATNSAMQKAYEFFESEIQKVRAGKISTQMLDDIKVDY